MGREEVIGYLALLGVCCGLFLIGYALPNGHTAAEDVLQTIQVKDNSQDKAIEELQKEVRLLKTDIQILQNGYEEPDYE